MAAASTARRPASRVRATKTAASNDDDPSGAPKTRQLAGKKPKPASANEDSPATTTAPRTKAAPPSSRTRARPGALVQRVYNTIDGELTKLEKQKGLTSQHRERASRALSQMVNALEKAVEMQRDMTKRKPTGGDAKSKEALAHAEDLRREIAERLERLNRKRAPQRSSE
jgi:hypothetical protein